MCYKESRVRRIRTYSAFCLAGDPYISTAVALAFQVVLFAPHQISTADINAFYMVQLPVLPVALFVLWCVNIRADAYVHDKRNINIFEHPEILNRIKLYQYIAPFLHVLQSACR